MSYKNEHFDHIFYRMRETLIDSQKFYYLVIVVKILPLFLLTHSAGYSSTPDPNATIHSYFKYVSTTFYIENSFGIANVFAIIISLFFINLVLLISLIFYILRAKKVQKYDENYGNLKSLDFYFPIFSNICFFKFVLFSQFFYEINFLPLVCLDSSMDFKKMTQNEIFNSIDQNDFTKVCTGTSFTMFLTFSSLNILFDTIFNYFFLSRFFDMNILSNFFWNCYPNMFYSLLTLESFGQIFFILFLNWNNEYYKNILSFYVYFIVLVYIIRYFLKKDFYSIRLRSIRAGIEVVMYMIIITTIFNQIIFYTTGGTPNDLNMVGLLVCEIIISLLYYRFLHRKDHEYIVAIITSNLNKLKDQNIYPVLEYLVSEFNMFQDVNQKFDDQILDIFLETYVQHLKICEDKQCPCKNYLKKVANATNTLKNTNYHTVINLTNIEKNNKEEYILNKFFNVLSANVNTTLKFTNNNVNINNIKDNGKQKLIYNLRLRLINAVKKLVSYRLEMLFNQLDGIYHDNFGSQTKQFIRINYLSLHIICNKSYYKTVFQYFEHLSNYFRKHGNHYTLSMIFYYYLKQLSIREYNDYIAWLKSTKKDSNIFNLDFRTVLSLCVRFYDIEEKLLDTVKSYRDFVTYFENSVVEFETFLQRIKTFKTNYKNFTGYIKHFFKNDKLDNLFICSKIILFYKILQFDIPENLHNKLIVQSIEDDSGRSSNIDTNYYLITNYDKGDFNIKFVSHELLIILEYSVEELRGKDIHILLPDRMRLFHKHLLISEIKSKTNHNVQYKEIFFISKKRTCILFDLHYKILLNFKGEITVLCVLNLKKPKKDLRNCFVCLNSDNEILAMNREFEEYLLLSMKVLDFIHIDCEKIILQNLGTRIKSFFKDEENHNSEFFEKFDYEFYLTSLFGEEFESLRDKNETLYKKKQAKWEYLKEIIRRSRSYNRYIDIYVRMRGNRDQRFFFIKYLISANMAMKALEPYNTTLSLINAVKMSKREMAKLSFVKQETMVESTPGEEDKFHESRDFLNESQSVLSQASFILKEKNSKKLFRAKKNQFKFLPKTKNIFIVIILLAFLSICSIIYTVISLILKKNALIEIQSLCFLCIDVSLLKNSLTFCSESILTLSLYTYGYMFNKEASLSATNASSVSYLTIPFIDNQIKLVNDSLKQIDDHMYQVDYWNSLYFNSAVQEILVKSDSQFLFAYDNGLIYTKGNKNTSISTNTISYNPPIIYKEIISYHRGGDIFLNKFIEKNLDLHFSFIFFEKLSQIQGSLNGTSILSDQDIYLIYMLNNLESRIIPFMTELETAYQNLVSTTFKSTKNNLIIIKVLEFFVIEFIILVEFIFIFMGYEKAKKKMRSLKSKVKENNVQSTMGKIAEYIKFCNTFNIYSLNSIADFELQVAEVEKLNEEKDKTLVKQMTYFNKMKTLMNRELEKEEEEKYENEHPNRSDDTKKVLEEKSRVKQSLHRLENLKKKTFQMGKEKTTRSITNMKTISDSSVKDSAINEEHEKKSEENLDHEPKSKIKIRHSTDLTKFSPNLIKKNASGKIINISESPNDRRDSSPISSVFKIKGVLKAPSTIRKEKTRSSIQTEEDDNSMMSLIKKGTKGIQWATQSARKDYSPPSSNVQENSDPKFHTLANKKTNAISNMEIGKSTPPKSSNNRLKLSGKFINLSSHMSNSSNDDPKTIKKGLTQKDKTNDHLPVIIERSSTKKINNSEEEEQTNKSFEFNLLKHNLGDIKSKKTVQLDEADEEIQNKENFVEVVETDNNISKKENTTNINPNKDNNMNYNSNTEQTSLIKEKTIKSVSFSSDILLQSSANQVDGQNKLNNTNIGNKANNGNTLKPADKSFSQTSQDNLKKIVNNNENTFSQSVAKDYNLIGAGGLKFATKKNKIDKLDKEEIEVQVEHIQHSNTLPKLILYSFSFIFFILYLISIVISLTSLSNIETLTDSSLLLIQKVNNLNNLILSYKLNLIKNNTKIDLKYLIDDINKNLEEVQKAQQNSVFQTLYNTAMLESEVVKDSACDYLSKTVNSNITGELKECLQVGQQMNKNGLASSYSHITNTLGQFNSDLILLQDLSDVSLLKKLSDPSLYDLEEVVEYTFRKYDMLLNQNIISDLMSYILSVQDMEDFLSYISIVLNLIFTVVSLWLIILPIKSVQAIISWLIHKLTKNHN